MKFSVGTASYAYSDEEAEKLKEIGFKFDLASNNGYWKESGRPNIVGDDVEVEIENLDALLAFVEKFGGVILNADAQLTIYDDYIE